MKKIPKHLKILFIIIVIGSIYHSLFWPLNDILKVADSFAYLQMAERMKLLQNGAFGNGWFGFFYSIFLVPATLFDNSLLVSQCINLVLLGIGAYYLYKISSNYVTGTLVYLPIVLYYISPTILHFNIHVLSENIYITLFIALIYYLIEFGKFGNDNTKNIKFTILSACILALMYYTRAEAFIYLASIGIISLIYLIQKKLTPINFLKLGSIFLITFFVAISPYILYLHSITGEWGLSNKGSSNMRQALLRGQDKMDDEGFEQAVAELTDDNKHLKAGFAGGMEYDKPEDTIGLGEFLTRDLNYSAMRISTNLTKFVYKNNTELYWGKSPELLLSEDSFFFKNPLLIIALILSLIPLITGIIISLPKNIFIVSFSFLILALCFFNIFFILTRYFLFLIPLYCLFFTIGIQFILSKNHLKYRVLGYASLVSYISVLGLSTLVYINAESPKDDIYTLKKDAGEWLQEHESTKGDTVENINMLERFPIVTYYSGSLNRWITPYTESLPRIIDYAQAKNIDYLIVDTMDFIKYRPKLEFLLDENNKHQGLEVLQVFEKSGDKVIIYKIKK